MSEIMNMALSAPVDPKGVEVQLSGKSADSDQSAPLCNFKEVLNKASKEETQSDDSSEPVSNDTMVNPDAHQESVIQADVKKPVLDLIAGGTLKNTVNTPAYFAFDLTAQKSSGDAINNTAIINPIALRDGQNFGFNILAGNSVTGNAVTGNAVASNLVASNLDSTGNDVPMGDGKIPYEANSPPGQSNSPPQESELNQSAGPRGNDLSSKASTRFTEEADLKKTQREVLIESNERSHSPNLMREYFRMPVQEISKGNINHPTNASKPTDIQPEIPAQALNSFESKMKQVENTTANNGANNKAPQPANRVSNAETNSSSNSNQDSSSQNSSQKDLSEFDFKVISQKNENAQFVSQGKSSNTGTQSSIDINGINAAVASGNGAVKPDVNVIDVKEPVSILGNAPVRIASEIAQADSEGIPNGGKSVLKIELNPPRLGRMNIELIKSDAGMEIKLIVRTGFARELITQRGDEIKAALVEMGVDIRKFEIVDLNQNRQDFNRGSSGFESDQLSYERGGEEASERSAESQINNGVDDEIDIMPDEIISDATQPLSGRKEELNVLA